MYLNILMKLISKYQEKGNIIICVNLNDIDVFERKFLKSVLNLREQTTNITIYGEYGRIPISYKLKEKAIKYFLCAHNAGKNHLLSRP